MFENLKLQSEDKIMALMSLYKADERKEKIDLGVGVYKNNKGQTPIMDAVQKASRILNNTQKTKSYVGLSGNLGFIDNISQLVLADVVPKNQIIGAQAPGGTGAFHQLLLLIRSMEKDKRVWISSPSWPNHAAILNHLGIQFNNYNYFDYDTCEVNFSRMMSDLQKISSGDVLLLHGCCHNPTGANLSLENWTELTQFCEKKNILPLIDLAYQGFGDGINDDVKGVQYMASNLPEVCIGISCSKNFGLYRERVGAALMVVSDKKIHKLVEENLKSFNRVTFSFPPDYGASLVEIILGGNNSQNKELIHLWEKELNSMRNGMLELRKLLSDSLRRSTNSTRFDFIERHRGMFSLMGLSVDQVARLRTEFGIYMVGDSRINIAGLNKDQIDYFSSSIAAVI
ncbi:MAG: aromatic amino acid aminotransferase [Rhodobacterales bacterium]|nr:aromatic amino acid aminotransferase [Rhodobacterales bacterium]